MKLEATNKKFTIGVLVSRIDYGAAELLETKLAIELSNLGHRIILIPQYTSTRFNDKIIENEISKNLKIHRLCFDKPFIFIKKLIRIRSLRMDAIISHNRGGHILASLICLGNNTKDLKALHEYYHKSQINSILNKLWKISLNNADYTYHITNFVLNKNRETFGLKEKKSKLVSNSVDFEQITEFNLNTNILNNKQFILTVARIVPNKGYHNNLDIVIPLLKDRDDLLYVYVGDDSIDPQLHENIKARIKQEAIEHKVFYLGQINNVLGLMKRAKVLLHFANHEGFGLILLEALRAQIPIITSNVGGIPDVLKKTEFKPFDLTDIKGARELCCHYLNNQKTDNFKYNYNNFLNSFTHKKRAKKIEKIIKICVE